MQQRTLVALKTIAPLTLLSFSLAARAQTVIPTATVNWTDVHQTIDGFGAACAFDVCDNITSSQARLAWDPVNGIGMSLLRVKVPEDGSCTTTCNFGPTTAINSAIGFGAKIWATPWSPPASMKSNGDISCTVGGGNGTLLAGSFSAYATYLSNYVRQFKSTFGPSLYALSVQNEPDQCKSYASSLFTATNYRDFIKNNLSSALSGTGVKLMMPEPTSWNLFNTYDSVTLGDSTAFAEVNIFAAHGYGNATITAQTGETAGGAHLWETEVSDFNAPDATMTSALTYAKLINDYLTIANVNAFNFWWLINGATNNDNEGLIQFDGTVTKRLYSFGNFSKFVRPGWVRIGATANPVGGVFVSAYKDPNSGTFAIVAINQNSSDEPLNLVLNGFTAASVTPWVTSASLDLAQQPSMSAGSGAFSGTLLASSVTTFVSNLSSTAVAPPTNLNATVH